MPCVMNGPFHDFSVEGVDGGRASLVRDGIILKIGCQSLLIQGL